MGHPRSIFIYFRSFQTIQFLQQINVKKYPSSILRWDSNSQPSDYESPPLTTRPGLLSPALKPKTFSIRKSF